MGAKTTKNSLPNQSGNAGKYLTTDNVKASWANMMLGTWTDISSTITSAQQAAKDGFVLWQGSVNANSANVNFITDSNASPTTVRAKFYNQTGFSGGAGSICCPVRKGDYYKMTVSSSTFATTSCFFIATGN